VLSSETSDFLVESALTTAAKENCIVRIEAFADRERPRREEPKPPDLDTLLEGELDKRFGRILVLDDATQLDELIKPTLTLTTPKA
jgi:hypothetical protein